MAFGGSVRSAGAVDGMMVRKRGVRGFPGWGSACLLPRVIGAFPFRSGREGSSGTVWCWWGAGGRRRPPGPSRLRGGWMYGRARPRGRDKEFCLPRPPSAVRRPGRCLVYVRISAGSWHLAGWVMALALAWHGSGSRDPARRVTCPLRACAYGPRNGLHSRPRLLVQTTETRDCRP